MTNTFNTVSYSTCGPYLSSIGHFFLFPFLPLIFFMRQLSPPCPSAPTPWLFTTSCCLRETCQRMEVEPGQTPCESTVGGAGAPASRAAAARRAGEQSRSSPVPVSAMRSSSSDAALDTGRPYAQAELDFVIAAATGSPAGEAGARPQRSWGADLRARARKLEVIAVQS